MKMLIQNLLSGSNVTRQFSVFTFCVYVSLYLFITFFYCIITFQTTEILFSSPFSSFFLHLCFSKLSSQIRNGFDYCLLLSFLIIFHSCNQQIKISLFFLLVFAWIIEIEFCLRQQGNYNK
jgi:hypothetical protein